MDKNRKIDVMGIINLTDNSYFAESRCLDSCGNDDMDRILQRAGKMVEEGATILDIGACSTRPGSDPVGEDEEWRRLEPALKAIRKEFPDTAISVDTYWPSVVRKTFDAIGKFIVNDVTAGEGMYGKKPQGSEETGTVHGRKVIAGECAAADEVYGTSEESAGTGAESGQKDLAGKSAGTFGKQCSDAGEEEPGEMLRTVARLDLPFVAMHMRGNPKTMQALTDYSDVTADVMDYFRGFAAKAEAAGVNDWILDPGFGFAKTVEQNFQLLRELDRFTAFGRRILVGMSRKSMIYRKFDITPEEALPATQVLHYKALCLGADILRVHDVAEAARTIALYRALEP